MASDEQKLEKALKLLELVDNDYVTGEEFAEVAASIIQAVEAVSDKADEYAADHEAILASRVGELSSLVARKHTESVDLANKIKKEIDQSIERKIGEIKEIIASLKLKKGDKGDTFTFDDLTPAQKEELRGLAGNDADTEEAARMVLEQLEPLIKELEQKVKDKTSNQVSFFGARGVHLYVDGVKKGIVNNLNFKSGDSVALSYSKVNGRDTITFEASSPTVNIVTPTGTVNASNTVFTVSAEPQYVVADGATYFAGAGYSYSNLTITMDVAPSASIRAII